MAPSLSLSKRAPVAAPPPPSSSSSSSSTSSTPRSPFRAVHFPAVVVTGASSGIGSSTVSELASRGFFVFGCVRKLEDAAHLVSELGPTRFCAVEMDVCDEVSVRKAADFVGEALVEGIEGEGWEGDKEEGRGKKKDENIDDDEGSVIAALGGSGGSRDFRRLLLDRDADDGEDRRRVFRTLSNRRRARSDRALLAGLVNCAGVAVPGPMLHQPLSEIRKHLEINYVGATAVTQAFAPLLGAGRGERFEEDERVVAAAAVDDKKDNKNVSSSSSPSPPTSTATKATKATTTSRFAATSFPVSNPGTIVQISSTAGKLSAPFIGAYAASKHALEASSDSLRREIRHSFGVDVAVVEPGAVSTPIWDKAERHEAGTNNYDETPYKRPLRVFGEIVRAEGRAGHPPQRIAKIVAGIFEKRQRQLQIKEEGLVASLIALPFALSSSIPTRTTCVYKRVKNWTLPHLLPDRASDFVVAAILGMTPAVFFAAELEEKKLAAAEKMKEKEKKKEKVAGASPSAAAVGGDKGKKGEKKNRNELAVVHCVVAAVALVAAVVSFATRAIVS